MPTLIIDDREISVKPGATIMEAARLLGIQIPHFCYHPGLSVAGNCRMCMVEVEKMPKPVISCAMPVNEGMVVRTNSEMVKKARRGVMEFLLINHPLDCPVCDQGGECKLQDYALKYGPDRSRFQDRKRTVPNPDMGPVIETEMNRCIQCTRCIRFSTEVAGVEEMGAIFRGDHMKVVPYLNEQALSSELSGNLAEICPVGALNLKPFHFRARGWELSRKDGICPHCAVGCHTRVDFMNDQIYRIKARSCAGINQEWLCDKGRFAYEGMEEGRLQVPMVVAESGGPLIEVSWAQALDRAAELLKGVAPEEVAGLAGAWGQGAEELYAFQDFLRHSVGTPHLDHRLQQKDFSADTSALTRADLMLNTPLAEMETADAIFLVGADPRHEMPILNVRLRKASLNGASVWSMGPCHLEANLEHLEEKVVFPGEEADFLRKVLQAMTTRRGSRSAMAWAGALRKAKRPVILLGRYAIDHPQAELLRRLVVALLGKAESVVEGWNGYNRMVAEGNAAAAEDMGVVPHRGPGHTPAAHVGMNTREILANAVRGGIKVLFLMGVDTENEEIDAPLAEAVLAGTRVIHLGAFNSRVAEAADVVLPGLVHGERSSTLTNGEGRVQRSERVVNGPLTAKEDWRILRALSQRFARVLPYDDLKELRAAMGRADGRYDPAVVDSGLLAKGCDHGAEVTRNLEFVAEISAVEGDANRLALVFEPSFHQDTPVARRSPTMTRLERGVAFRIGSKDARKYGIVSGGKVYVECNGRSVVVTATVDERMEAGILLGTQLRGLGGGTCGFLQVKVKPY
ncbi:MAG: NADH-quinone oxidoreductase subunit NuoG [Magnetococcales bacterium]|nr:NADH-quinone oxidoreductase subunit NuoG [Magnetococcales bacterium]MBF0149246.1 NADH-quinone oxidoreductase subunit NuoG [Magnetococcales bacterium]MBF0348397.1 NADH-quinone oxidoreductase subunit NuoG [Magnetococcales bacterium]MBF0632418.1 NADH-quinone oxidoreductase subunit NuoG [Magnetococcales bacterium]